MKTNKQSNRKWKTPTRKITIPGFNTTSIDEFENTSTLLWLDSTYERLNIKRKPSSEAQYQEDNEHKDIFSVVYFHFLCIHISKTNKI